jgi:hypothetical protein
MKIKTVEAICEADLIKIVAGNNVDGIDCSSELASGGTTTDTYQDSTDVSSELASGGGTSDTYITGCLDVIK